MGSKLVEHFAIFGNLSNEEAAAIGETMRTAHFRKGTVLLEDGQFSSQVYFVSPQESPASAPLGRHCV